MVASELSPDYRASVAEAVEALGAFTTASKELRECYSGRPNPAVACPALSELQYQKWTTPVHQTTKLLTTSCR
jgi:hypothetical protein